MQDILIKLLALWAELQPESLRHYPEGKGFDGPHFRLLYPICDNNIGDYYEIGYLDIAYGPRLDDKAMIIECITQALTKLNHDLGEEYEMSFGLSYGYCDVETEYEDDEETGEEVMTVEGFEGHGFIGDICIELPGYDYQYEGFRERVTHDQCIEISQTKHSIYVLGFDEKRSEIAYLKALVNFLIILKQREII